MGRAAKKTHRVVEQSCNNGAEMNGLQASLSALRASQTGIDVTAQNLANANTPGFHRRDLVLQERILRSVPGSGTGVDVDTIRRIRSAVTEGLLTANMSDTEFSAAKLESLERLEVILSPGSGSLNSHLQSFFASMHELSARSGDPALQRLVVGQGAQLAEKVRSVSNEIHQLRTELDLEIAAVVSEVNSLNAELADLQRRLIRQPDTPEAFNALEDQFERVVNQLAEHIDVRPDWIRRTHVVTRFAGGAAVVGQTAPELTFGIVDGTAVVTRNGSDTPLRFPAGKLGGLLSARNEILSRTASDIDSFARDLILAVDTVHAGGIGQKGSFDTLLGVRGVDNVDEPLATSTDFPISGGSLFVSVTNTETGDSTLSAVEIDPGDSLRDLAGKLSLVDGIHSTVIEESGTLSIAASPNHTFDFTGRLTTRPDPAGVTGTSQVTVSGRYSGDHNEEVRVSATTSGTVGVTEDFFLEVHDAAGSLLGRFNVGRGYEPGSLVEVADGVFAAFTEGSLNSGDAVTLELVATADTTGLLVAVGLNSFFAGLDATGLTVNAALSGDPNRLATSYSGSASDSRNLNLMLGLRDEPAASGSGHTLGQSLSGLSVQVGNDVAATRLGLESLELSGQQLQARRDAVSGVDPNEELVRMMTFQRSFQAASRVIATIEATYDDLFSII